MHFKLLSVLLLAASHIVIAHPLDAPNDIDKRQTRRPPGTPAPRPTGRDVAGLDTRDEVDKRQTRRPPGTPAPRPTGRDVPRFRIPPFSLPEKREAAAIGEPELEVCQGDIVEFDQPSRDHIIIGRQKQVSTIITTPKINGREASEEHHLEARQGKSNNGGNGKGKGKRRSVHAARQKQVSTIITTPKVNARDALDEHLLEARQGNGNNGGGNGNGQNGQGNGPGRGGKNRVRAEF